MEKALKTMIDNMPDKTGKSLEEWKEILTDHPFEKHSQGVKFLKEKYSVTHGFANTIVTLSKEEKVDTQGLVKIQYEGKEHLIPVYDKLISLVKTFGQDVLITPKKGSVSIVRKKQFALIKPATKTRIDLGLKLVGKENTAILENSGPFGTMCTHRVRISEMSQIDEELVSFLKEAYEKAN